MFLKKPSNEELVEMTDDEFENCFDCLLKTNQPERLSPEARNCEHCGYPKKSPFTMIVTCSCI